MPFDQRAHPSSDQNPLVDPCVGARPAPVQIKEGQRMPQKQQVLQQSPVRGPHVLASETAAAAAELEQCQTETNQP